MSTITTLTSAELDAVNGGALVNINVLSPKFTAGGNGGNGGNGGTAVSGSATGNTFLGLSASVAYRTGYSSANGGNGGNGSINA